MYPRVLFFSMLTVFLTACLPFDNHRAVGKQCTLKDYESNLVFDITTPDPRLTIPGVISGQINSSLQFDECQTSSLPMFTVERFDDHHARLILYVTGNSKIYEQFFGTSDTPQETPLTYYLYGRAICSDDPLTFQRGANVPLTWTPVHANGPDCGTTGYTAEIQ